MFHVSNLGSFGAGVPTDMNGYVPEETDDDPWAFEIDHGAEGEENPGYAEWWEEEGWPEFRRRAVEATAEAEKALAEWRR